MFKGPSFHHTGDFDPQAFDSDGLAGGDAVEYVYISL
jgi:hypothetical protein